MRGSLRGGIWLLLWLFVMIAGRAAAEPACPPPSKAMARLELVFGFGHSVNEPAFRAFLGKEVTPRFPDGLSLFSGYGQWRNGRGRIIKEASRLLLIWYVPDANSNAKIEAIRKAYETRFHQQSVLRADGQSCVSF
jgi:hypothetical protein